MNHNLTSHVRNTFVAVTKTIICILAMAMMQACAHGGSDSYRDTQMDFGSIRTVAVMPLSNLSKDNMAAERVRDVLCTMLMSTGAIYVLPAGEVSRGIASTGMASPLSPTADEVIKFTKIVKADGVITGVIREYGDVRSGNATADTISLSLQLQEAQTGRVVWSAASTQGGISISDRLFGGGGRPLNDVTQKAINDLINKLFE